MCIPSVSKIWRPHCLKCCMLNFIVCYSLNTLESIPAARNVSVTACSGNQIKMTCSHNEITNTLWSIGPPVNCLTTITHTQPPDIPPCGSSMIEFQNVTSATHSTSMLSSTAVVTANTMMSGSTVEYRGGNIDQSIDVGSLSLCIVSE